MPKGAEILTVQVQHGEPHIWVLVEKNGDEVFRTEVMRTIDVFGTGDPMYDPDGSRRYIGTCQLRDGRLVYHVFEKL